MYEFSRQLLFWEIKHEYWESADNLMSKLLHYLRTCYKETKVEFYNKEFKRMWKYYKYIKIKYLKECGCPIDESYFKN